MEGDTSQFKWPDAIGKLPAWITGFIAFVSAVVGFIKLWQGDTGLVTAVLLVVGVGGGWLGCAYLAFKRTPPLVVGGKGTWQYPRWRLWALAGLVIIPLLTAGGVGYNLYQQAQPPTKVIILVANFDGPEPQKYRVTEMVLSRLRQALEQYDDVKVEALGRAITEAEGSAAARAEGEKRRATIVIWGWYGVTAETVPLSVHFEVLRPPERMPELGPEAMGLVQPMAVAELESFALQTKLSAEMAYLSLFTVGMARYAAEDWNAAIACFSDALSQTADRVPALDRSIIYFYRAAAYNGKGEYDLAIADFGRAIELKPDYAEAYNNRGIAYIRKGEYDLAIADYAKTLELNPNSIQAHSTLGYIYAVQGKLHEALEENLKVLELAPNDYATHKNLALLYQQLGRIDEAVAEAQIALGLAPEGDKERLEAFIAQLRPEQPIASSDDELIQTYLSEGQTHLNEEDFERAEEAYTKALELNPNIIQARSALGYIYALQGKLQEALEENLKVLELAPNDYATHKNLALIYQQLGYIEEATAEAETALELAPESDKPALEAFITQLRQQ